MLTKRPKWWTVVFLGLIAFSAWMAMDISPRPAQADDSPAALPAAAAPAPVDPGPTVDPNGSQTGGLANVPIADAKAGLTLKDVADRVGKNVVSINIVWTLVTGFLVMFMQAGFAMVEAGLCRAKNASHTMAMNFMIYPLGMLGFYVCGFAFMFGGFGGNAGLGAGTSVMNHWLLSFHVGGTEVGLLGGKGYFLGKDVYDVGLFALFLFQMVFMDTTATIPTGAMAERWKFSAFMLYGAAIGTIIYPVYGCWVWGNGWLANAGSLWGLGHGVVDFAGSSVVHMQGGVIALVGAWFIGPRVGKYNKDGSVNAIPAHNVPMVVIGTFILAFGWSGFNPGSTLAGTDLRIAVVATNTMLASATGALAAALWIWFVRGDKPDPTMMCNGMLAGLVAITAPCAFVNSAAACFIGLVSGVLVVESVLFIDRKLKIDDPVGAISVHGVNGAWGVLSLGLFADGTYGIGWNGTHLFKLADGTLKYLADPSKAPAGAVETGVRGLFYGDPSQLGAQILGVVCCFVYVALISLIVFWVIEKICGNRVSVQTELDGLDLPEMGVPGYAGIILDKAGETPFSR